MVIQNTLDYVVKKYNIDLKSGYIIDIPGIGRDDLAKLFNELDFNKGVEVGVERGLYSEVLLKANDHLHLSCVDPWSAGAYEPGVHAVDKEQEKYDGRYGECVNRLKPYNATIIRQPSLGALRYFKDNSLDFVYIDANHDFTNFTNDLHNWIKKVHPGGIIAGHDYARFSYKKHNHVWWVINAYMRCYRMVPLFIAGSMEYKEGVTRDKYRSWFWIKQ